MLPTSFTLDQVAMLALAMLLAFAAFMNQVKGRTRAALVLLTGSAVVLRLFAAFLDPFLNVWDEVFHAVVARNMMDHPFTPMLYTEAAMPITTHWPHQHFWLHKPPFFLWQMALSMKVFGITPWAIRLPSVLWTTALVPVTWRMGTLLFDKRVGFAAAVLITFSYLLQELTAGAINTDHNDAVFISTLACSLWALLEHWRSGSWKWAIAVGVFSSCAILTKWHVGLLVFLPWAIVIVHQRFPRQETLNALMAFATAAVPVSAWLLYIRSEFPVEAAFEWSFKSRHFSMAIDGHEGTWLFHFDAIRDLIPPFSAWVMLPALAYAIIALRRIEHRILLLSVVLVIHFFFAFAQTKMVCYTMVLLPFYMIAIGHAVTRITHAFPSMRPRTAAFTCSLVILAFSSLDEGRTEMRHTIQTPINEEQYWRKQQLAATNAMDSLATLLHDPVREVVFNFPAVHNFQFMFAHGYQCWDKMPMPTDVERLHEKGYTVYALQDGHTAEEFPAGVVLIPDSVVSMPRIRRL